MKLRYDLTAPNIGALTEHIAIAWLMSQGFEVFKNVSPIGEIDLIIRDPETFELTQIDVKTANALIVERSFGGQLKMNFYVKDRKEKMKKGVNFLYVLPNGYCAWGSEDLTREEKEDILKYIQEHPEEFDSRSGRKEC